MMNMLITCSANISTGNALDIYIGPQVDLNISQFTVEKTRIFLKRKEIDRFKNLFQESFSSLQIPVLEPAIRCLRQLSSSFNHISTYKSYRATLTDFEDTRFMPITVFTHCDTPNYDGYGALDTSCSKMSSLLLQLVSIGLLNHTSLDKENLDHFFTTYDSANPNGKSWIALLRILKSNVMLNN
jgi:hypothetical protein